MPGRGGTSRAAATDRPEVEAEAVRPGSSVCDRRGPIVTRAFVVDASVAIGWVHPAQATKQTATTLDAVAEGATLEVPALWPLEVANALTVLVRRRKLTEDERRTGLGWFLGLRLRVDHEMAKKSGVTLWK